MKGMGFRAQFRAMVNEQGRGTLADIQRNTGIPYGTLQNWYRADRNSLPNIEEARLIARFFKCSMEYLVTSQPEEDYQHPSPAIQHLVDVCERDPELLSMFLSMAERSGYGRPTRPDGGRENNQGV
mgnify:CR=1 FL=1